MKKLIGIVTIILILGIILVVGIRSIKATPRLTQQTARLHPVVLPELGSAAHSSLLLVDLELTQAQAGLQQHLVSATQVNHALHLTPLQDLLTTDALTRTNVDLGLLGLNG